MWRQKLRQRIDGSAPDEHEVARRARHARGEDLDLRPGDLALAAVGEADLRAGGLEVVEVLGVDPREALGVERLPDEGQRGRRGVAGVVPAAERADDRRGAKPVGTALPDQGLHPIHGTSWAVCRRTDSTMTVATLRPGQEVDGVFACTRKDRLMSRGGTPYLALELRDRTGAVQARAFRDADVLAGRFERGDLVRVAGRVERFRDELQVEVRTIGRAPAGDVDPAAFLPGAYRDLDELDGFLEHLAREVHDAGLRALLGARCSTTAELREQWRRAPCTRNGHHAYLGGLLEHTVAVGTLALEACQLHPRLDSDLLVAAALVHDLGKTREFTYGAEIGVTERAGCSATSSSGSRCCASARRASAARQRAAARARALRADPPRRRRGARPALRLGRGARAAPPQRARRVREGRARARARPALKPALGRARTNYAGSMPRAALPLPVATLALLLAAAGRLRVADGHEGRRRGPRAGVSGDALVVARVPPGRGLVLERIVAGAPTQTILTTMFDDDDDEVALAASAQALALGLKPDVPRALDGAPSWSARRLARSARSPAAPAGSSVARSRSPERASHGAR